MTREHKLALIVGFSLFLVLGVLVSDHFSKARQVELAENIQPSSARQVGGDVAPGLKDNKGIAGAPQASPLLVGPSRLDLVALPKGPSITTPGAPSGQQLAMGPQQPLNPLVSVHARDTAPHVTVDDARHPAETPAPQPQIPVQKYEVKDGDTLYRITLKNYGDVKLVEKLREYNKLGSTIHEGVTILLPPKEILQGKPYLPAGAQPSRGPAPTGDGAARPDAKPADAAREYVVKSGDTLMAIARKMLSSESRYSEIEDLNPGVDSTSLKIGMKLRIPAK